MAQWNDARCGLVAEALQPADDARGLAPVLVALLDFDVHARLLAAGFSTADAASLISGMIIAWMKGRGRTAPPTTKPRRTR